MINCTAMNIIELYNNPTFEFHAHAQTLFESAPRTLRKSQTGCVPHPARRQLRRGLSISASVKVSRKGDHWSASDWFRNAISTGGRWLSENA